MGRRVCEREGGVNVLRDAHLTVLIALSSGGSEHHHHGDGKEGGNTGGKHGWIEVGLGWVGLVGVCWL